MSRLRGKTVLITGAGNGIGAQTARELWRRGANLGLIDVDEGSLAALVSELGDSRAVAARADVTDLEQMEAAAGSVRDRFGAIDVIVANAGVASYGSVLEVDPKAFTRVIDINLNGVFFTVRAALADVIERRGYVLVVCSLASYLHSPGLASYNASKAGAEHFANALRLEVAHLGVEVGSAHMSWIDTPLVRDAQQDLPVFAEMKGGLPGPLSATTSPQACARAFVRGIERRERRVWVPGWVRAAYWLRSLLTTGWAEREQRRVAPRLLPRMDEEVAALGRSLSAPGEAVRQRDADGVAGALEESAKGRE